MWLLNTTTCELSDFTGQELPPYAILSHTWSNSEVLFRDMETFPISVPTMQKPGFVKISQFCQLAKTYGFDYGWVDSCCIDKRSSAELSEAINSMHAWYRDAGLCIVYLYDVPYLADVEMTSKERDIEFRTWVETFKKSRWFTRGWTLQELIAPEYRLFFASDWTEISPTVLSAQYKIDLINLITSITHIPAKVLRDSYSVSRYCIATRMSWASTRTTTRPEDAAYCLLGLFNAAIPILYGEGLRNAFARLQEEIMKSTFDQTLFVWRGPYMSSGLLARCPSDFANTPQLEVSGLEMLVPHHMTNTGLYIRPSILKDAPVKERHLEDTLLAVLQCDVLTDKGWSVIMIRLKPVKGATCWVNGEECMAYRRVDCGKLEIVERSDYKPLDLLVLEDRHHDLVRTSMRLHDRRFNASLDPQRCPQDRMLHSIRSPMVEEECYRHSTIAMVLVQGDDRKDKRFRWCEKEIRIAWTMKSNPSPGGNDNWTTQDLFSTLPDGPIAESGAAFFNLLVRHVMRTWLELCDSIESHLTHCMLVISQRPDIFYANGGDPSLIVRLLEDANSWLTLRRLLLNQMEEIGAFRVGYTKYGYEDQFLDEHAELAQLVNLKINVFDACSRSLIHLVFNLKYSGDENPILEENSIQETTKQFQAVEKSFRESIHEAQKSISLQGKIQPLIRSGLISPVLALVPNLFGMSSWW